MLTSLLFVLAVSGHCAAPERFLQKSGTSEGTADSVKCPVQEACLSDVHCYPQDGTDIRFGPEAQPCFFGPTSACMNCYEYATNNPTLVSSTPGETNGVDVGIATGNMTCESLRKGVEADGGVFLSEYGQDKAPQVTAHGHNILLLVTTTQSAVPDFHFVRQDADGTWSQKHGSFGTPTQNDAWGKKLGTDPWNANWTISSVSGMIRYQPCGYYHVDGSLKISGLPRNESTREYIEKQVCSCTLQPDSADKCGTFIVMENSCTAVYHNNPQDWPKLVSHPCTDA